MMFSLVRSSQISCDSYSWRFDSLRSGIFPNSRKLRSSEWSVGVIWSDHFYSHWSPITAKSVCWDMGRRSCYVWVIR